MWMVCAGAGRCAMTFSMNFNSSSFGTLVKAHVLGGRKSTHGCGTSCCGRAGAAGRGGCLNLTLYASGAERKLARTGFNAALAAVGTIFAARSTCISSASTEDCLMYVGRLLRTSVMKAGSTTILHQARSDVTGMDKNMAILTQSMTEHPREREYALSCPSPCPSRPNCNAFCAVWPWKTERIHGGTQWRSKSQEPPERKPPMVNFAPYAVSGKSFSFCSQEMKGPMMLVLLVPIGCSDHLTREVGEQFAMGLRSIREPMAG
mmetsp:Transcript_24304/g.81950  ORF Transcript_24304/g.81950 Transcript_24304/m.81950 type:complete len:262 (+) Transcript_24304:95-880(+)